MIIKRFVAVFKAGGVTGVVQAVVRRLRMPHARSFATVKPLVAGARGLEIGGPSPIFAGGGLVPVYPVAGSVDNVNFARDTIWEGKIAEGASFVFHPGKAPGRQFIAEGAALAGLPDERWDFILSSHMLEHTADPLRALNGWRGRLRAGGTLVLILPHRDGTFDHRRPVTTLAHLKADHAAQMGEDDLTHVPEVLELHDLARDPGVTDLAEFQDRVRRNPEVRSVHHHVFDTRLAMGAVVEAGYELVAVEAFEPYHIMVVARVPAPGLPAAPAAESFAAALRSSPFATDRA